MSLPSMPLIDATTLAASLDDPRVRVFDATASLERPPGGGPYTVRSGRERYRTAHIPGAAFADTPGALSAPDAPLPFTLPEPEHFAAGAGALGIAHDTQVVVYAQAAPMWATRLWWLLRYFGHEAVSVLDGGLPAWQAAGLATETGERGYPAAEFQARSRPELLASLDAVRAVAEQPDATCLLNALRPEVFRGEGPASYSRPGRIPGSVNVPYDQLLDPQTGTFLPCAQLRARFEQAGALGGAPVIAYCGGGISATVAVFALFLLGRTDVRLYDGSLAQWSADPSLPLEVG